MKITVFTPTFNRSHLLTRLYDSLCSQSYSDFEWIIVDDGSTDKTCQLVNEFLRENKVAIRYFYQNNSGKYIAINKGLMESRGDLFFIVDSDDILPEFSLLNVSERYKKIADDDLYAGLSGRKALFDSTVIGTRFPNMLTCSSLEFRYLHNVRGDMAEVFKTKVLKKFLFPESSEKFCPEALVFNRISEKYKMLWYNEVTYLVEYLPDGLSSQSYRIRKSSPVNSSVYYEELSKYKTLGIKQKCYAIINYWRFVIFVRDENIIEKSRNINVFISLILMPIIVFILIYDRIKYLK